MKFSTFIRLRVCLLLMSGVFAVTVNQIQAMNQNIKQEDKKIQCNACGNIMLASELNKFEEPQCNHCGRQGKDFIVRLVNHKNQDDKRGQHDNVDEDDQKEVQMLGKLLKTFKVNTGASYYGQSNHGQNLSFTSGINNFICCKPGVNRSERNSPKHVLSVPVNVSQYLKEIHGLINNDNNSENQDDRDVDTDDIECETDITVNNNNEIFYVNLHDAFINNEIAFLDNKSHVENVLEMHSLVKGLWQKKGKGRNTPISKDDSIMLQKRFRVDSMDALIAGDNGIKVKKMLNIGDKDFRSLNLLSTYSGFAVFIYANFMNVANNSILILQKMKENQIKKNDKKGLKNTEKMLNMSQKLKTSLVNLQPCLSTFTFQQFVQLEKTFKDMCIWFQAADRKNM